MNISKQFTAVSRRFVITIVALSVLSVGVLAFALYETNSIRFGGDVSSSELLAIVQQDEVVSQYVESEKSFEAHFVTIASLVKAEQQQAIGRALLITTIPVLLLVAAVSYYIARSLLRPMRESYESQERFLQDAAHELRNPLAAMSLALENAQKSELNQDFLRTMKRQTKRLIRINEDLLYLERRSPGEHINEINISELLEDVLEDLQPAIVAKKLMINKKIQSGILLKIDSKDFIKLSRNIIENAIKYSNDSKPVDIGLSQDKNITMIVEDNGIGIPEADLVHIGERFYRSKNATRIDGTGLGLAIVKKVLNVYGGELSIVSSLDSGTTVTVVF